MSPLAIVLAMFVELASVLSIEEGLRPGTYAYQAEKPGGLYMFYDINENSRATITIRCGGQLGVPPYLPGQISRQLNRGGPERFKIKTEPRELASWYKQVKKACPEYKDMPDILLDTIVFDGALGNNAKVPFFGWFLNMRMFYKSAAGGYYVYHDREYHYKLTMKVTEKSSSAPPQVSYKYICSGGTLPFGPFPLNRLGRGGQYRVQYKGNEYINVLNTIRDKCRGSHRPTMDDYRVIGFATKDTIYTTTNGTYKPLSKKT
ncbi:hypothetical protein FOZ61_009082 [Perkinsus olseni]|uniref:Uncharacterized protein n=1 Tax=Perkinsus olseni TaxID=32597 RepID=A0A7J6L298_PEROL|nr:hypothetical protein FOZ61_009082 [Perkinsus olseni]KAF4655544.1 hypothetical protein FOL46_008208 [Perkinsus olseni]